MPVQNNSPGGKEGSAACGIHVALFRTSSGTKKTSARAVSPGPAHPLAVVGARSRGHCTLLDFYSLHKRRRPRGTPVSSLPSRTKAASGRVPRPPPFQKLVGRSRRTRASSLPRDSLFLRRRSLVTPGKRWLTAASLRFGETTRERNDVEIGNNVHMAWDRRLESRQCLHVAEDRVCRGVAAWCKRGMIDERPRGSTGERLQAVRSGEVEGVEREQRELGSEKYRKFVGDCRLGTGSRRERVLSNVAVQSVGTRYTAVVLSSLSLLSLSVGALPPAPDPPAVSPSADGDGDDRRGMPEGACRRPLLL